MSYVRRTGAATYERLAGNPTLPSLDGEKRASLGTIISEASPPETMAEFGVFLSSREDPPAGKVVVPGTERIEERDGLPVIVSDYVDPPPPTLADYEAAIENLLNSRARERGYRDIFAAVGYVNSTIPHYAAEAAAYNAWRDEVWLFVYALWANVEDGEVPQPSVEDLLAALPELVLPPLVV